MWPVIILILLALILIFSLIKISIDLKRKKPTGFVITEGLILLVIFVALLVVDIQLMKERRAEEPAVRPETLEQSREAGLLSQLGDYLGVLAGTEKPQVQFLLEQGQRHRISKQYAEALDVFEQALDLELSEEERLPFFILMGNCEAHLEEYNSAINYYYQAERIAKEAGDDTALVAVYSNIALAHQLAEEPEGALGSYFDLLELFRKLGNSSGEKNTLASIGFIFQTRGNADSASFYHQKSLEIPPTESGLLAQAAQMNNLALAYKSRGMLDSALALHQQALPLFQGAGDGEGEASVLANMGLIYQEKGELEQAISHYQNAFEIDSTIGNLMGQAGDLTNIGSVLEQKGDLTQAKEFYRRALSLFEKMEAEREIEFVKQNIRRVDRSSKK